MSKREREGFLTIWLVSVVIIVISYGEDAILYMQNRQSFGEVAEWLQAHSPGSERNEGTFYDAGTTSENLPLHGRFIQNALSVS